MKPQNSKKSFLLHKDSLSILNKMSDVQAGVFIKILYNYQTTGNIPEMDFAMEMAVTPFINQFERDNEKYQTTVLKRVEAGKKGADVTNSKSRQMSANADSCRQKSAKSADSVNVNDNDNDNDNDSVNENENENVNNNTVAIAPEFIEFDKFRKEYPGTKRGNDTEFANFKKRHKDWKLVVPLLLSSLNTQKKERDFRRGAGQFVPEWKNLQTWINQRCWEESIAKVENKEKSATVFQGSLGLKVGMQ
jgi:hypothetical protein